MKKWYLLTILLVILALAGGAYFITNRKSHTMITLNNDVKAAESMDKEVTFKGKQGEDFIFEYTSEIREGSLIFVLSDKDGVVVKTFEGGESVSENVVLEKGGTYTLQVSYDDFVGSYYMRVENE